MCIGGLQDRGEGWLGAVLCCGVACVPCEAVIHYGDDVWQYVYITHQSMTLGAEEKHDSRQA